MLDREPGLSLRRLATRLGMTAPRLCQLLNLLKLPASIRRALAALPPVAGRELVTENALRRLAVLSDPLARNRAFRLLIASA